jgi:hypothetical protein
LGDEQKRLLERDAVGAIGIATGLGQGLARLSLDVTAELEVLLAIGGSGRLGRAGGEVGGSDDAEGD